jgi:hypothetical protein
MMHGPANFKFKNVIFIGFFVGIFGQLGTLEEKFVGVTYELN